MLTDVAQVKGYVLLSYSAPLQKHEPNVWVDVCEQFQPEVRDFFAAPIYASSWYPRLRLHELLVAYGAVSDDPPAAYRRLGALAANHQINSIYKLFLKFATPAMVFRRATSLWSRQSSVGLFRVLETADDHLIGELIDPNLPVGVPDLIAGWSDAIIKILGKTPRRTTWELSGTNCWRFRVSWE